MGARKRTANHGSLAAGNGRLSLSQIQRRSQLVGDVMAFIRRFVVMTDAQLVVVALWAIHTHCVGAVEQTPYLAITSPEKQCGKSRLIEVLEMLVARPWMAVLPSEAVVYRTVDQKTPTLLLDEVDAIFNPRTADRYEGLRALLNSGHRRGSKVPRCVGATNKVVEFSVFCPKLLAGIGTLPDTVADRSIPVRLERRKRNEPVERLIRRDEEPTVRALRDQIAAWAASNVKRLRNARPEMPEELSDRMQEGCESLVAIADRLHCGGEARAALVELLGAERLDDQESMRLRLLRDIKTVFEQRDVERGTRAKSIRTTDLLLRLAAIEEAPWANYYGRGLDARDLAALLRHYGISSVPIRLKGAEVAKGYKRDDFYGSWQRYL